MFNTDASSELTERYNMDPEIWKKSQRTTFPFTLTLNQVIGLSALTPVIFYVVPTTTSEINW